MSKKSVIEQLKAPNPQPSPPKQKTTTQPPKNRLRNKQLHFMVTEQEKEQIKKQMQVIGTQNMGGYLRKMAIDGQIIKLDTTDVKELVRLLRVTSNSLNQLTKHAHITGSVDSTAIEKLRQDYYKLWDVAEKIMLWMAGA